MLSNLWPSLVVGGGIENQVRRENVRWPDRAEEADLQGTVTGALTGRRSWERMALISSWGLPREQEPQ